MSFFESASLVFISDFAAASASAVSGSGTTTGKAYSIKPVEELGSELVVNGDFATDSDWTKGTGWTISGGTANCDGTQTSSSQLKTSVGISIQNTLVKFSFEVKNYSAGNLIATIEGTGGNEFSNINSDGIYTIETTSTDPTPRITFTANSSFVGSIDNVSVKEVITPLADFDFERGSDITATRVNSSGLIEKGRGNFLLQSNQFDTSPWNDGGDYTINPNQNGYDGSTDAWLLNKNTVGNDYLKQNVLSTDSVNTISLYAKEGSVRGVKLVCGGQNVNIDLRDGSIISTGGSNGLIDAGADLVSGTTDWYRVYLTKNIFTTAVLIKPTDENGAETSGNIYIQDAQLEQGLVATDYIETTTEPLRAGILEDEPRFDYHNSASATPNTCPSLLLEPGRTNLITNSEYIDSSTDWQVNSVTVEDNSITSPENQTNAAKLTGTVGDIQKRIYQSFSQVSGEDFTTSIFAKEDTENILFLRLYNTTDNVYARASFNLSTGVIASNDLGTAKIENYGNGWYRCILTGTPSTTTTTGGAYFNLTSDGNSTSTTSLYLWGAQIEQDSYATSYIPTYGTSATRGIDFFDSNADFTNFFETNQGTIYIETAKRLFKNETNNETFIGFREDSSDNYWRIVGREQQVFVQCIGWASTITYIYGVTNPTKYLFKWDGTNVSFYIDGALIGTAAQTATFSPNAFGRTGGGVVMNSAELLNQFTLFPTAISNTDCEILTGATTYSSFAAMVSALNYTVYE